MSHKNNQHATRLREMIDDLACFGLDADGAAALTAGAEALEAVEVAKAALLNVRDHARPTHREDADEVCYDWCPLCAVTAALARLEGSNG
jgi:hypothetical protein